MATSIKVVNGDISINTSSGRPTIISGTAKLKQDLNEFFNVDIMPSGFGCGLERLIGTLESGQGMLGLLDRYITDGIAEFMNIQQSDTTPRTPSELISSVNGIQSSVDPADPTRFYFKINIVTQDGASFPYATFIGK